MEISAFNHVSGHTPKVSDSLSAEDQDLFEQTLSLQTTVKGKNNKTSADSSSNLSQSKEEREVGEDEKIDSEEKEDSFTLLDPFLTFSSFSEATYSSIITDLHKELMQGEPGFTEKREDVLKVFDALQHLRQSIKKGVSKELGFIGIESFAGISVESKDEYQSIELIPEVKVQPTESFGQVSDTKLKQVHKDNRHFGKNFLNESTAHIENRPYDTFQTQAVVEQVMQSKTAVEHESINDTVKEIIHLNPVEIENLLAQNFQKSADAKMTFELLRVIEIYAETVIGTGLNREVKTLSMGEERSMNKADLLYPSSAKIKDVFNPIDLANTFEQKNDLLMGNINKIDLEINRLKQTAEADSVKELAGTDTNTFLEATVKSNRFLVETEQEAASRVTLEPVKRRTGGTENSLVLSEQIVLHTQLTHASDTLNTSDEMKADSPVDEGFVESASSAVTAYKDKLVFLEGEKLALKESTFPTEAFSEIQTVIKRQEKHLVADVHLEIEKPLNDVPSEAFLSINKSSSNGYEERGFYGDSIYKEQQLNLPEQLPQTTEQLELDIKLTSVLGSIDPSERIQSDLPVDEGVSERISLKPDGDANQTVFPMESEILSIKANLANDYPAVVQGNGNMSSSEAEHSLEVLKELMSDTVTVNPSKNVFSSRLTLTPKTLGQVTVEMKLDEEGLSGRLIFDSEEARNWLENNWQELKLPLESKGLDLNHFDFVYAESTSAESAFSNQFSFSQDSDQSDQEALNTGSRNKKSVKDNRQDSTKLQAYKRDDFKGLNLYA